MNGFCPPPLLANFSVWAWPLLPLTVGILLGVGMVWGGFAFGRKREQLGSDSLLLWVNAGLLGLVLLVSVYFCWVYLPLETRIALVGLGTVLFPYVVYLFLTVVQPKVATIAQATTKETVSQPQFWVILFIGFCAMVAFPYIPYHTFGEDIKILKDSGLTLIMTLSIMLALWTASVSIAEEIEGKTALTVLSKPVSRRHFILGKFFGISGAVVLLFIVLGAMFVVSISFKVSYEASEAGGAQAEWQQCWAEIELVLPGLVLALFEVVVLTSISVAISTRLPMIPNLIICTTIYVVGHLIPLLVSSAIGRNPIVQFVGYFLGTVLPMLEYFNIQAPIAAGREVPLAYVAWAGMYSVLYCTVALLGALILFEDRDLA